MTPELDSVYAEVGINSIDGRSDRDDDDEEGAASLIKMMEMDPEKLASLLKQQKENGDAFEGLASDDPVSGSVDGVEKKEQRNRCERYLGGFHYEYENFDVRSEEYSM